MTTKHLAAGSEKPARTSGNLRLYGMRFCPYVHRIRLVLEAKGVPYDEVFVCLKSKPEWLFEMNAQGKVPVIDTGDQVLAESLDIADYLDEKNPQPPMYPVASRKAQDKELIEKFGKVIGAYGLSLYGKENKGLKEYFEGISGILQEFEDELIKRGTTFFSGNQPGMIDYMMWPWAERSKIPAILKKEDFNFPKEKFPKLVAWRVAMQEKDPVKKTMFPQDKHLRFIQGYLIHGKPEYLDDEF